MAYTVIETERRGGVAVIRLNDPGTLNALSQAMLAELAEAVSEAEASARALVLIGSGRAFSSGANLNEERTTADLGESIERRYNPLVRKLRDLRIPYITAVGGVAAGAGCSLALTGDLIVAGEGASFILAFRRIGLIPDAGSTFLLTRAVGRARAMELMLLGEALPAAKALAWGLINRVVPDAELEAVAFALAEGLAQGPTRALGLIRKAGWAALDNGLDAQLDCERDLQREAGFTEDFKEGVAAFREKRPARFTGT
ncbi:enoyl-CoA hydratase-related protein [Caulobacter sp. S45]|uniref:enoyl-CoA hydratase-related protein n=1 Tax=Caulobacter sp. S45 TaxID=1641861 RepID=UPI00131DA7A3|nr:enoyl-CoA hydratase-related protein [Caulobacter sp. S45]